MNDSDGEDQMMTLDKFLREWTTGGILKRERFRSALTELLRAERERCAYFIETRLTAKDSLDGRRMQILADGIRELQ